MIATLRILSFSLTAIAILFGLFILGKNISLSVQSHRQQAQIGIVDKKLKPCPKSANCITSYAKMSDDFYVSPIPSQYWGYLISIVNQNYNLTLERRQRHYMHIEAQSTFFRFVDDIELLREGEQIHIRSISRVGQPDFGTLRNRIEELRKQLVFVDAQP